ncbi:uncharacterized protein TM35_000082690 [Trypanosoma theileri]|uniref:Uncharacterized protein n=1 Tax=Trypanosoma theileri TaxID=67003 RepID=A0A1X0P0V8_9TRYP|nr:uncharacterized protein TM35_000082690 [Trypanosoma theileri]ORC90471.1 hypothetical protein TM35_000082690 [Trypanosoma theileri]
MASSSLVRVKASIADTAVKRLIVCIGCANQEENVMRGALGNRVAQQILNTCSPSPSDIHNPDVNRLHPRDALGRARRQQNHHQRKVFFKGTSAVGSVRRHGSIRNPQTWDSERVVDYLGVWCDRLLLGEHTNPSRCALLEPRVPPIMFGESLERVLRSHRNFQSSDLLFIFGSSQFEFGTMRLISYYDDLLTFPNGGPSTYQHSSIGEVLQRLAGPPNAAYALVLGIGDSNGVFAPLTAEENVIANDRIIPLASFTSALWTVDPKKAMEYLLSNPRENLRLWRTMQSSLLSTRDTAVLRAYESGVPLDARISQQQTNYLAETLLSRLFPQMDEK